MTTALTIIVVAVALCAVVLLALWLLQERIVFQPPLNPGDGAEGATRLEYRSRDGVDLAAYVVEPAGAPRAVVVAFHGNAVIARWMIPWARELARRLGVAVVLPEYRGYDGLPGTPTYPGSAIDAEAALAAVERRFGVPRSEVILFGHSLGTAIACEAATASPARALLLESPFTSVRAMAGRWRVFGLTLLWERISRVHYDTVARVSSLDVPVHVVHGERDILVPVRMGRAVHAAARTPGALLLVPLAGHNDVAAVGGDAYWRWFEQAIHGRPQ